MSFVVSDAISDMNLELNLVGQRMSDTDYLLFLDRANKYFYTNYKMPTCQSEVDMLYYDGVKEYSLPSDFASIIEPKRPYDLSKNVFVNKTEKAFTHQDLGDNSTAIKWVREVPLLILKGVSSNSSTLIQACESTTQDGTWVISGDGSLLAADDEIYSSGGASLRFTVTASTGQTVLSCSNNNSQDLTDLFTFGKFFVDLFTPSTNSAALTSVKLRLGSSPSAYYEMSATTRFRGDTITTGLGQIGFDPAAKTTTGSPDITAIDYVAVVLNYGLTGVDGIYHLDNIFGSKGTYYQLPYYSKYNVKDSSNSYKQRVTATDDTILCPDDFNEIYTYKCNEMAAAIRLRDQALSNYFRQEMVPKEMSLKARYPKMESIPKTTWYANTKF